MVAVPVPFITDQTPPAVTSVNWVLAPAQTVAVPVIGATVGLVGAVLMTIFAEGNDVPDALVTV